MPRYTVVEKRHHPIRNLLVVLLVLALVYVAWAGVSLFRVYEDAQTASSAYRQAEAKLSSGDVSGALSSARSLCTAAADIGDQADMWVWVVGEQLPWIGEDVAVGRGLAHVSDSLCNQALLPALEAYESVSSSASAESLTNASSSLQSSATTVSECSQELSSLGTSHFSQLNELKDALADAVEELDGTISSVSGTISSLGSLASLL